jgi:cysteine desulfurase
LPGTLSLLVPNVDGRMLVTRLDLEGLQVSAGSACASGSIEPSHVLSAMGYSSAEARAALRVSIGRTTTLADVRKAVETLRKTLG